MFYGEIFKYHFLPLLDMQRHLMKIWTLNKTNVRFIQEKIYDMFKCMRKDGAVFAFGIHVKEETF